MPRVRLIEPGPPQKRGPRPKGLWLMLMAVIAGLLWVARTWWLMQPEAPARNLSPTNGLRPELDRRTSHRADGPLTPSSWPIKTNLPLSPNEPRWTSAPTGSLTARSLPTTNSATITMGRPVQDLLEVQIALARRVICTGSIDGVLGDQTRSAVRAFQGQQGLPITGEFDELTRARLTVVEPLLTSYMIAAADFAGLGRVPTTWRGRAQATYLGYESMIELVAERAHSHPSLIRRLNPGVNWSQPSAGTVVWIPQVAYPAPQTPAARIQISLSHRVLQAWSAGGEMICHFPCSIAERMDKRPVGELRVQSVIKDPNYTFKPELFPESVEARSINQRLVLPAGPNSPVGVAWIGLDRPGFGIHGTPRPEDVGRTESHGCFRLANWNVEYLRQIVVVGTRVVVEH